jgi:hypothetical protein
MMYRKHLLSAVEAFLHDTPASIAQGQQVIEQCYSALNTPSQRFTLNGLIWRELTHPLTDSVFFTSQEYLLEVRKVLQGFPSKVRQQVFIKQDLRPYMTDDETEWYAQLLDLFTFIQNIPFAEVAKATAEARQQNISGYTILATIPEAIAIVNAHEEYQQRIAAIDTLAANIPHPESLDEETIYRFILREVSDLVTNVDIRASAIYQGYPTPLGYSLEGDNADVPDLSELLAAAKRTLDALSGIGNLCLSWRLLANATSFDADLLLISLH